MNGTDACDLHALRLSMLENSPFPSALLQCSQASRPYSSRSLSHNVSIRVDSFRLDDLPIRIEYRLILPVTTVGSQWLARNDWLVVVL